MRISDWSSDVCSSDLLNKTTPIPCVVREDGILEEDSLAENVQRQALHPLDQFRAFQSLKDQGLGEADIAARFFVTPQIVKQRLKLASVSAKLLEIYAADAMRSEEHTYERQSLMRISYAVFCLTKKHRTNKTN